MPHFLSQPLSPRASVTRIGLVLAALCLSYPAGAWARQYPVPIDITSVEDLYELQRSGDLDQESVDALVSLYEQSIDLNRATAQLLYDLPEVTLELAQAMVSYRLTVAPFAAIEDLLNVPGMTDEILGAVRPFVTVALPEVAGGRAAVPLGGKAFLGAVWRQGFGKDSDQIDPRLEREKGVQGYLRFEGHGWTNYEVGGLVSYRRRTSAYWDYSRGYLVTPGPTNEADANGFYVSAVYPSARLILGSYNVGFGERLTFDTSTHRYPHGWESTSELYLDYERGTVRPRAGLFGVAATWQGPDSAIGATNVTVFASHRKYDLYQYDFAYGLDPWYGANSCQTDSQCPEGYTCGDDGRCRSTRLYDADDPQAPPYRWETLADLFVEDLAGGNINHKFNSTTQLGVTAYGSRVRFDLARHSEPNFALGAALPTIDYQTSTRPEETFGAVGVDGRIALGPMDWSGEFARTFSGGNGVYLRTVALHATQAEVNLAFRSYDPKFENPHGRGEAAADEADGLRARNEQGGKVEVVFHPIKGLRLVNDIDLWRNPYRREYDAEGRVLWKPLATPPWDLSLRERVTYKVTRKEDVSLVAQYNNKDLANNGPGETYISGDSCDPGKPQLCGRGEAYKLQLSGHTKRLGRATLWLSYSAIWQGLGRPKNRFDLFQQLRARVTASPWAGSSLALFGGVWIHDKKLASVVEVGKGGTRSESDREKPAVDVYLEARQDIGSNLELGGRYGILRFKDQSQTRYSYYHIAALELTARY